MRATETDQCRLWAHVAWVGLHVLHYIMAYIIVMMLSVSFVFFPVVKMNDYWCLADRCGAFEICYLPVDDHEYPG